MPAQRVLLVEPANFASNPETSGDNFFQHQLTSLPAEEVNEQAKAEFNALVETLAHAGIEAVVFRQEDNLQTPDSVFPNNWFSTFPDKTCILYPMMAENRRLERRKNIVRFLESQYNRVIDLTHDENRGIFLEGTGSLVIDHTHRIAYASLSQRTSSNLIFEWEKLTGYNAILFSSYDKNQQLIYHTNVVMCLAENYAIVCLEAMEDEDARGRVKQSLLETGFGIIDISMDQLGHFCGNCLELENKKHEKYLLMSTQAYHHFTESQKKQIEKFSKILHVDLHSIETHGGGSARCMVAELF